MPKPKGLMDCHALNYQEFDFHNRDVNGLWTHNIEEWYNAHINHHSQERNSVQITHVYASNYKLKPSCKHFIITFKFHC